MIVKALLLNESALRLLMTQGRWAGASGQQADAVYYTSRGRCSLSITSVSFSAGLMSLISFLHKLVQTFAWFSKFVFSKIISGNIKVSYLYLFLYLILTNKIKGHNHTKEKSTINYSNFQIHVSFIIFAISNNVHEFTLNDSISKFCFETTDLIYSLKLIRKWCFPNISKMFMLYSRKVLNHSFSGSQAIIL